MSGNNTALMDAALESGVKKASENIINRAANALTDFVKKKYKEHQVDFGTVFEKYLHNASLRYNKIRTLATGNEPRSIIGDKSIYVSIGVRFDDDEISTDTVERMLKISNNILILGSGGVGKSMLMRYLFLNTANRGDYIPVLLELRRISNQAQGNISILDLIYTCMLDYDVQLPREQFEYSLRSGCYIFLLDGLDEVKESLFPETAEAIQKFCAKYPNNPCIITSRPRQNIKPLETFTIVKSMVLTKEQAVSLASKIWKEDEKTKEFCKQLKETLFDQHKDFAENPLLLSMMFLTFMRNNSIPEHLCDFYQKAYDALYSAHDTNDKGYYTRDFKCNNLDESKFKLIFSRFCFQTYFKEIYEFSEQDILFYIRESIQKLKIENITAQDYLEDLRNAVCMIIKDGNIYRFSHRSFQTYFTAYYTSCTLTDEQQKRLFISLLSCSDTFWDKEDYYKLLIQIEPERFAANALEDKLRTIHNEADNNLTPNVFFLKSQFNGVFFDNSKNNILYHCGNKQADYYDFNVIGIFLRYYTTVYDIPVDKNIHKKDFETIKKYILKINNINDSDCNLHTELSFVEIDNTNILTGEERNELYCTLIRDNREREKREAIRTWLKEVDEKRQRLNSTNFIDEL